ncbi:hypothetical protein BH09PSE1_BH09PSE1_14500 [soil metagenome]
MRYVMIAAAALMASACTPINSGPVDPSVPGQRVDASSCAARGGEIRRVGRMQSEKCVIRFADAGKQCTDGDQCAGDCRIESTPFPNAGQAAEGKCQAESQNFGCHASVEDGKASPAICID